MFSETLPYFQTSEMCVMRFEASRGSCKWSSLSFNTRDLVNLQHVQLPGMCGVT